MAIDEAILISYIQDKTPPTLRMYGWTPGGISLGYFQKAKDVLNIKKCQQFNIPYVRRITGGEAIFHENEVAYSIVCSKQDLGLFDTVKDGYKKRCAFLINTYKTLGLNACFFFEHKTTSSQKKRSDFCFATNQDFDISVSGKKLGGNAQKRIKDIIFQHGSVPLRIDFDKIALLFRENLDGVENKVTSLEKATGKNIDYYEFSSIMESIFKQTFNVRLFKGELTKFEQALAKKLIKEKYNNVKWNNSIIQEFPFLTTRLTQIFTEKRKKFF